MTANGNAASFEKPHPLAKFGGYQPQEIALESRNGNTSVDCIFSVEEDGWYLSEFHSGRSDARRSIGTFTNEVEAQKAIDEGKVRWTEWA
jgi:hypothetical protein